MLYSIQHRFSKIQTQHKEDHEFNIPPTS